MSAEGQDTARTQRHVRASTLAKLFQRRILPLAAARTCDKSVRLAIETRNSPQNSSSNKVRHHEIRTAQLLHLPVHGPQCTARNFLRQQAREETASGVFGIRGNTSKQTSTGHPPNPLVRYPLRISAVVVFFRCFTATRPTLLFRPKNAAKSLET